MYEYGDAPLTTGGRPADETASTFPTVPRPPSSRPLNRAVEERKTDDGRAFATNVCGHNTENRLRGTV